MQIQIAEDTGTTAKVVLTGKLDIAGAEVVALPLATLSGAKSALTIDMSGVTFIASIGIRHLVSAGKALRRRGGSLTLLDPSDIVTEVLDTTGVADLMTITRSHGALKA
jgi:anti-sigma B factor antagonist